MCLVLANRSVKFAVAYLSPTQSLIELDLTNCLSGGFLILMVDDLSTEQPDWNYRLTIASYSCMTVPQKLLLDLLARFPHHSRVPSQYSHGVLDIMVVKDLS
jgi:hypothetical protein